MFRHLLKLTWKRKTRNLMLSLEILLAFAIVFAVAAFGLHYWQLSRMPIGFDAGDVWAVTMVPANRKSVPDAAIYDALRRGVGELPEVLQVSVASFEPYSLSSMGGNWKTPAGTSLRSGMLDADDHFAAVLGLRLLAGRWFSPLDDGAAVFPVVLNRRMAEVMFPGKPAVGQQFADGDPEVKTPYKVVGVIDEYRASGEFMTPENFVFVRFTGKTGLPGANPHGADTLLVKLRPGTARSFESRLSKQLKLVRNDWTFQIAPVADTRKSRQKLQLTPVIVLGVIGAFMLVMVAFGLFGALWQNTAQRIPEIGLRRAVGARATDIYSQIVAEQLLLSSVAIVLGLVLLVQLPLTGVLGESLDWSVFLPAAGLSMSVIYLLSLLCSLYPGWRASRLSPTEALHYE
jgi:putative ABC transport system permease protein